jgi:hypothetical protein
MLTIPGHKKCKSKPKCKLRFHLTPVRIASIKNTTNNKCCQGCREKGTLTYHWWKCEYNHYGKQYGGFFKNSKSICHMIQQYHF